MPAPAAADFRARYPQFNDYPDDALAIALAEAYELTGVSPAATLACAAHLLVVSAQEGVDADGGAGVVTAETIGPRIVSYATQASGHDAARRAFFAPTAYGRRVLALEDRSPGAFAVIVA